MQSHALHALAMCWGAARDLDQALHIMRRALKVARGVNYAHGLGQDLVDLSEIHWRRGERLEAQATTLQEATVWFAFVEDQAALEGTSRRLKVGKGVDDGAGSGRGWVKSHLTLAEGQAYCEFE